MGHLQTVEQKLRELIAKGDTEALVRFVKSEVLTSYRNGQAWCDVCWALQFMGAGRHQKPPPTQQRNRGQQLELGL